MNNIRLYLDRFWISPYSFSVFVALKEKQAEFEVQEVGLDKGEHNTAEYRRQSRTGRIPSLQLNDFHLAESSAIVEYLEDLFPTPPLFPQKHQERAKARMIMAWLRSDLHALRKERPTTTMFYQPTKVPPSEECRHDIQKLIEFSEGLIAKDRATLFNSWSLVDAELSFMLHRLILNSEPLPAHIKAYAESHWQRPSVQEFVQRKRPKYVAYGDQLVTGTKVAIDQTRK